MGRPPPPPRREEVDRVNRMVKMLMMTGDKDRRERHEMEPQDRGYRRTSDGRFAPRGEMEPRRYEHHMDGHPMGAETWVESKDYQTTYVPVKKPAARIGFDTSGMERRPEEFSELPKDEMEHRTSEKIHGHGAGAPGGMPFSREMADMWASGMENEDGSRGPHWALEQTRQVQTKHNIQCDPIEFWAAMNMVYSDYVKVARKHGVGNNTAFYADMAKAFLEDKDAQPDKLSRYFAFIVRH